MNEPLTDQWLSRPGTWSLPTQKVAADEIRRLHAELADALKQLSPANPRETLIGAIRNVQQVALTNEGNVEHLEKMVAALNAQVAALREALEDIAAGACTENKSGQGCDWACTAIANKALFDSLSIPPLRNLRIRRRSGALSAPRRQSAYCYDPETHQKWLDYIASLDFTEVKQVQREGR